jgi:oligopeptide transport system substrate-binding protein
MLPATVLALSLLASACRGQSSPPTGAPPAEGAPVMGGTLVDYYNFAPVEPDHIDPALAVTVQASQPGHLIFDGLTDYDYKTGELRPAVAESWRSNDDATVWTFRLRPGVLFSNGDRVLPSDFKYGWERAVRRETASAVAYHITENLKVKGAKALAEGRAAEASGLVADDANLTLTVELEAPLSFTPDVLAHLVFSPVPRRLVEALPDGRRWEQSVMVGNGPYRMAEPLKPGQYVKLVRNDSYWGGIHNRKPYLDTIEFRVSQDLDSAWAAFESGQGQTGYIPPGRYAEARAKHGSRVADQATLGLYFWGFNLNDPIVGGPQNRKLRQAISLVADKQKMLDDVYNGSRKLATGIAPPGLPGYKPGISLFPSRDVDRARRLLGEWERETNRKPNDLAPLRLNFPSGAGHAENAIILQANLKEVGIPSQLDGRDPRTYASAMRQGEGQFFQSGWIADYAVYDNMLFPLFGSSQIDVGDNQTRYSNPAFDTLIDRARRTNDPSTRNAYYQQAEALVLNEETALVPLNWFSGTIAWSDRVRNVIQGALQFVAYDQMWLAAR